MLQDECERHVDERHPGLLGEHGERVRRVQLALVLRQGHVETRRHPLGAHRDGELLSFPVAAGEPAATDDPGAPATDRCDVGGVGLVDKRPHGLQQFVRIDRMYRRIIESDVVVRRFDRRSPRARAAERDRGDTGHASQCRYDAV